MSALCRHFGTCGGCTYQDMPDAEYRATKSEMVQAALASYGFSDATVEDVVEAAPATRRRATFKAAKSRGRVELGFHAARSHSIVNLEECRVMTPTLTALVPGLRAMLESVLHDGEKAELHVTEAENGFDVVLDWKRLVTPKLIGELAPWAARLGLARLTGSGEPLFAARVPSVHLGSAEMKLPVNAFLQATLEGERALQERVIDALRGAKRVADLFCGCGTFSLPLARQSQVHAVEQNAAMLAALAAAARATQGLKPLSVEKRDLFKRPLTRLELAKFDAVVLDPPRAGAQQQVKELARSGVPRIAYVSCNAMTFARDARILVDTGYRMGPVTPVDQFLWSSHIELVAGFSHRQGKS